MSQFLLFCIGGVIGFVVDAGILRLLVSGLQMMLHQAFAHVPLAALHQAEHARMQTKRLDRGVDGLGHDLSGTGMGGMALDHDRTARGQGRGRVATCGREGEREIRGAEYRNRPDRALHHLQVGPRRGLFVSLRQARFVSGGVAGE